MAVIDLAPSFYCFYIVNSMGEEVPYFHKDISPNSKKYRLDLFENQDLLESWLKEEKEIYAEKELWGIHAIYELLFPKKVYLTQLTAFISENENLDSITFLDKHGVRQLYFRADFESGLEVIRTTSYKFNPKETIYIINRQRSLDEKTVLQREAYFITYPEIATPLFSPAMLDWARELIDRKPNQGYYVEATNFQDIYARTELEEKDPGFYILSMEEGPHYILRKKDLKRILEGSFGTK